MRALPYSVHAEKELADTIKEVKERLEDIKLELLRYESLTEVHYGHVGDVKKLANDLFEAFEFILEEGH